MTLDLHEPRGPQRRVQVYYMHDDMILTMVA